MSFFIKTTVFSLCLLLFSCTALPQGIEDFDIGQAVFACETVEGIQSVREILTSSVVAQWTSERVFQNLITVDSCGAFPQLVLFRLDERLFTFMDNHLNEKTDAWKATPIQETSKGFAFWRKQFYIITRSKATRTSL